MTTEYLNKPLFSLTVGEFIELQKNTQNPVTIDQTNNLTRYVYGLAGLAELLNCTIRTAQRIKSSGRIDKAVIQTGRTIAINAELAMQLLAQTNKN